MNTRLMTFEELSENRFLLEGRMVEFPFVNENIFVGEVIGTVWWPKRHIRLLRTVEGRTWDNKTASWAWQGAYNLQFKFDQFELFSGPYETENGDIFFMIGPTFYFRIFHKRTESETPIGPAVLYAIHRSFIDPETPPGTIA